jgi:hypothetical protein
MSWVDHLRGLHVQLYTFGWCSVDIRAMQLNKRLGGSAQLCGQWSYLYRLRGDQLRRVSVWLWQLGGPTPRRGRCGYIVWMFGTWGVPMPHGSVVGGAAVREAVHGAADGVHPLQAVLGVPRDCMEGSWDGGGGGAAPQPRHVCAPRRQFIAAPVATGTSVASAAAAAPAFTGEGATAPVYAAAAAARSATPHRATAARAAATEASVYVVAVVVAAAGAAALPCRSHHCRHRRRGFERAHISSTQSPALKR